MSGRYSTGAVVDGGQPDRTPQTDLTLPPVSYTGLPVAISGALPRNTIAVSGTLPAGVSFDPVARTLTFSSPGIYALPSFTETPPVGQGNAHTTSGLSVTIIANPVVYDDTFAAAPNRVLSGYNNWVLSASPDYYEIQNGQLSEFAYTNFPNAGVYYRDLGTKYHALKVTYADTPAADGSSTGRNFCVLFDGTNAVMVFISTTNIQIATGVFTSNPASHIGYAGLNVTDGDMVEMRIVGGPAAKLYAQCWYTPKATGKSVHMTTDQNGGFGVDVTGMAGTRCGVYGNVNPPAAGFPVQVFHEVVMSTNPPSGVAITLATVSAPSTTAYATANVQGWCDAGVTQLEVAWASAANVRMTNWTGGFTAASGVINIKVAIPPSLQGQAATLWIRNKAVPTSVASTSIAIGYFAPVDQMQIGMNANELKTFGLGDILRDRAMYGHWFNPVTGSSDGIAYNAQGYPTGVYPGGSNNSLGILLWESAPLTIRTGGFTIHFPPGLTASCNGVGILPPTIDTANGIATVTLDSGSTSNYNVNMIFSGTPTAGWGMDGLKVTCLPTGDTSRLPMTDQFVADYGGAQGCAVYRFMKNSGAEGAGAVPVIPHFYTPEWVAKVCTQAGFDPWITFPVAYTDAQITDFLMRLNVTLPGTSKVYVEVGNEIWNGGYFYQTDWCMWTAANIGLVTGVPAGNVINAWRDSNPTTGVTSRAYNAGDIACVTGLDAGMQYQRLVVQAKRNVAVGATIQFNSTNDDFTKLAIYAPLYAGMLQWQGNRQAQIGVLAKSILGSRGVSCLGISLGESLADLEARLSYNNAWQNIDLFCPSAYFGFLRGSGSDSPAWVAKYSSDPSAFKAGFIQQAYADIDVTIANLQALKHGAENWFRGTLMVDVATSVPQLATYEGLGHEGFFPEPTDPATFVTRMTEIKQSSDWYAVISSFLGKLQSNIGGLHIGFVDYEFYATNNTFANQIQMFGTLSNAVGFERSLQQQWLAWSAFGKALRATAS